MLSGDVGEDCLQGLQVAMDVAENGFHAWGIQGAA
jgi:hypothetical protein